MPVGCLLFVPGCLISTQIHVPLLQHVSALNQSRPWFLLHLQAGMYFDNNTGLYAAGGQWYTVKDGQYVEYSGA